MTQALIQFIGSLELLVDQDRHRRADADLHRRADHPGKPQKQSSGRRVRRGARLAQRRRQQRLALGFGLLVVLGVAALVSFTRSRSASLGEVTETAQCVVAPFREQEAAGLIQGGAVIVV